MTITVTSSWLLLALSWHCVHRESRSFIWLETTKNVEITTIVAYTDTTGSTWKLDFKFVNKQSIQRKTITMAVSNHKELGIDGVALRHALTS